MLPDPLHPAVVHLPLALAALAPAAALLAMLAIRMGFLPTRIWLAILLLHAVLAGSAWLAVETGEQEEERVERVVAERHIEAHEEEAERLLAVAAAALAVSALGLLRGRPGNVGRVATLVLGVVALYEALAVGHSGGELVYRHGAASAYVEAKGAASGAEAR